MKKAKKAKKAKKVKAKVTRTRIFQYEVIKRASQDYAIRDKHTGEMLGPYSSLKNAAVATKVLNNIQVIKPSLGVLE